MTEKPKPWHQMIDAEKSEQLNNDMQRLRSGDGPDWRRDGKPIPVPFKVRVKARFDVMLREPGEMVATLKTLVSRGLPEERAKSVLLAALNNTMVEREAGGVDRLSEVLSAIGNGRTLEELFPKQLYVHTDDENPPG